MAKRRIQQIKSHRIKYKLNHHLIPENCRFDSWMALCEYVTDIAEDIAKKQLNDDLVALICKLSDEIVATAEEYEPEADH